MKGQANLWCIVVLLTLGMSLHTSSGFAQADLLDLKEGSSDANESSEITEQLPSYQGEGSFYLGFRWAEVDDSSRASEYEEDENSIVLGADGIACPLPHRYHMHGEYFGKHNYYGDVGYAYRDILLFRDIVVGVHHNLDHYNYSFPVQQGPIKYEDRNAGDENYVNFLKNDLLLRFKAPDYPAHAFFKYGYVKRNGEEQERYLIGDFINSTMTSQTREVDSNSHDYVIGLNSHLGPVEVEFAHTSSEFDPGSNSVLYDSFPSSMIFRRTGDVYPHNVIPETESFGNSVKIHSSFTGQVVASATFSNTENTNNYSGTESEVWKAAMDVRWIPDPVIALFLKYRHSEQDKDNPGLVTLSGLTNQMTYPVRQLVSTKKDLLSLSARYRPLSIVTLIGKYEFEQRERKDVDAWKLLPENSDVHRIDLTAHFNPMDELKVKTIYSYRYFENPAYNTEPDYENKVRLNATYTPLTWLTALFDYSLTLSQREDLLYRNSFPNLVLEEGERDGQTNRLLASLSFVFSPEATVTASWAYNKWKIEQDLTYALINTTGAGGGLPYYDRGVPYTDESNTLALSLYYILRKDLTLDADVSYTAAEGDYFPDEIIPGEPSALSSFSSMKTTQTIFTVGLTKKITEDWDVGLKFQADFYDNEFSEGSSDLQDGELFITTLTLKRYF